MRKLIFGVVALLIATQAFISTPAQASEQQNLIDESRISLDHLRRDREFGNAPDLMHRARGILLVPNLVKAGFFLGGEGGGGVMLRRNGPDSWSYPAFYTLASASFGIQIGLETSELALIVLTDKGMNALMSDEFKVGAQAGLALVTLGSTSEAATSSAMGADIVVWSSSSGLYAGLTLNGSIIKPRDSWNAAYYGQAQLTKDILLGYRARNPGAEPLRSELARFH